MKEKRKPPAGEGNGLTTPVPDAQPDKAKLIQEALVRLNDLFARSLAANDCKTALQAQRELNRLAEHLLPLGLADHNYPFEENARLVADFVRKNAVGAMGPSR